MARIEIVGNIGNPPEWRSLWTGLDGDDEDSYVNAACVNDAMNGVGPDEDIEVFIESYGGDAHESLKIYDRLLSHRGKVVVRIGSAAAGGAAWIAMAGDEIVAHRYSLILLTRPDVVGVVDDESQVGIGSEIQDLCDYIYPAFERPHLKMSREELVAAFKAETWFNAEEALRVGLIDAIEGGA